MAAAIVLCAAAIMLCPAAKAECVSSPLMAGMQTGASQPAPASPIASDGASGDTTRDQNGRVIAPVMINGRGPYPFIVDTGANRSVLSHGLAQELGLTPLGTGDVHSINSVEPAPLVRVESLRFGSVALNDASLPLLADSMLGVGVGLLGVDGMQGKRLRIDFEHRCLEIMAARTALPLASWVRVSGRLRFGHLVMMRGFVAQLGVNVLIDTGSDTSLANEKFREAVVHHFGIAPIGGTGSRLLTAGRPLVLRDGVIVPGLRLGDVTLANVPAYVGNFHVFDLWGFQDEPTILIGMDVLTHLRAIAIDYSTGTVQFRRPTIRGAMY